jgi:hypothetical protein
MLNEVHQRSLSLKRMVPRGRASISCALLLRNYTYLSERFGTSTCVMEYIRGLEALIEQVGVVASLA